MSDDAGPDSLTGIWNGLYSYASAYPESAFTAVLFESGGHISGTIQETMRHPRLGDVETSAAVDGTVDDAEVRFIKHYDGSGGQRHSVAYEGMLSPDRNEIEGLWSIMRPGATTRGRFLMIRAQRETRVDEVKRETRV